MGQLPLWGASLTAPREGQEVGFHTFSQVAVCMSYMSVCVNVYIVYECV